MQDIDNAIDTAERFNEFERAVIDAAESEANALLAGAEKEREDMLYKARHSVDKADYDKLSLEAERWRLSTNAAITGDVRHRLLQYREALVEELFTQLDTRIRSFSESADYKAYFTAKLAAHKADITQNAILYCKSADIAMAQALGAGYSLAVQQDEDIELGGFSLACGSVLYDETLDTARNEERGRLLTYCKLEVM